MELKTPLYEEHVKAGGKIVPFAGYLLPVQYPAGVIKEHMAVRTKAGLFDVSHMGEILCTGPDAKANLQTLLTNDYTKIRDGQAKYSPMCNEHGGTVDDLIVYRKSEEEYLIVVNAANKEKDYQWMLDHQFGNVTFTDVSEQYAQLALQGPKALDILRKLTKEEWIPQKYYHAVFDAEVAGIPCIVSKTGYTGEDGVELYLASEYAAQMWNALLEAGKEEGLIPCGLGARDTLRMEAAMPLYGHEMNEEISPLEAGLTFAVKLAKEEWIPQKYYHAVFDAEVAGIPCIVSKTGYTGEDGVELYLASEYAAQMWNALLEAGKEEGLIPCGLGARDTLRMEAAMPLYGHEMNEEISPLEAGLTFAVKLAKEDFIGKKALEEAGEPKRERIGLKVTGRGIIREEQTVICAGEEIGTTTSGTHCPYLGYPIAMALVQAGKVAPGDKVEVNVRGRNVEAEVVELPFYKRAK